MLGGAFIAAGLAAVPGSAVAPTAAPDAAIEAAWIKRQEIYAAFLDDENWEDAASTRYWNAIDEQEEIIRRCVATTPRGVLIQLWCALYHSSAVYSQEQDRAVTRADFDAVESMDGNMDWSDRLLLASLRSLKAMGA